MGYDDHKHISPRNVSCGVLIISDSRTEKTDESGKLILKLLGDNGHTVSSFDLLNNDAAAIRTRLTEIFDQNVQLIITSGGTGASSRDITIETVTAMLDKKLDGFGELFRYLTYQEIGTGSVLSRAMAGTSHGKVIVCLPGSINAVRLAMEKIILPEMGHMVREASR